MAARIIFCIEGLDARQYPSRVWDLAEVGAACVRGKAVAFRATASSAEPQAGTFPFDIRCSDRQHLAILREAIAEQANQASTACFIVLIEDREHAPVFHAEKVSSLESQGFFEQSWAQLHKDLPKAA